MRVWKQLLIGTGVIAAGVLLWGRFVPGANDMLEAAGLPGKLVAAICHGGWVLVSADVLRGKRCTSVGATKDDIKNAGAIWIDEPTVVDGSLVTAQVPKDLPAFCREMLAVLDR